MAGGTKLASGEDISIHDLLIKGLKFFRELWNQKMELEKLPDLESFLAENTTNTLAAKQPLRNKQLFHRFATEPDFVRNVSSGTLEQCIQQLESVSLNQLIDIRLIQPELRHLPQSLFHQQRFVNEIDQCIYRAVVEVFLCLDEIYQAQKAKTHPFPKIPSKLSLKSLKALLKPLVLGTPTADKAKCAFGREILLILGLADHFQDKHSLLRSGWWRLIVEIPNLVQDKSSVLRKGMGKENEIPTTQKRRLGSVVFTNNLDSSEQHQDAGSELERVFAARRKELENKENAATVVKTETEEQNDTQVRGRIRYNKGERQNDLLLTEKMAKVRKSMDSARSRSMEATTRALKESGTLLIDIFLNLSNLELSQVRPTDGPLFLYQDTNWVDCQTLGNGHRNLCQSTPSHLSCYIYELTPSTSLSHFVRPVDITSAVRLELRSKMTAVTFREPSQYNGFNEQLKKLEEEVEETPINESSKTPNQACPDNLRLIDSNDFQCYHRNKIQNPKTTHLPQSAKNSEPAYNDNDKRMKFSNIEEKLKENSKNNLKTPSKQGTESKQKTSEGGDKKLNTLRKSKNHTNSVVSFSMLSNNITRPRKDSLSSFGAEDPDTSGEIVDASNSIKEPELPNQTKTLPSLVSCKQTPLTEANNVTVPNETTGVLKSNAGNEEKIKQNTNSKEQVIAKDSSLPFENNHLYQVASNGGYKQNEKSHSQVILVPPKSRTKSFSHPKNLSEPLTNTNSPSEDHMSNYKGVTLCDSKEISNSNESRGQSSRILHGFLNYWCHATPQNSSLQIASSLNVTDEKKNDLQDITSSEKLEEKSVPSDHHLVVRKIKKSYDIKVQNEKIISQQLANNSGSKKNSDSTEVLNPHSCVVRSSLLKQPYVLVQPQNAVAPVNAPVVRVGGTTFSQQRAPSPTMQEYRNKTTQLLQDNSLLQQSGGVPGSFAKLHPQLTTATVSTSSTTVHTGLPKQKATGLRVPPLYFQEEDSSNNNNLFSSLYDETMITFPSSRRQPSPIDIVSRELSRHAKKKEQLRGLCGVPGSLEKIPRSGSSARRVPKLPGHPGKISMSKLPVSACIPPIQKRAETCATDRSHLKQIKDRPQRSSCQPRDTVSNVYESSGQTSRRAWGDSARNFLNNVLKVNSVSSK